MAIFIRYSSKIKRELLEKKKQSFGKIASAKGEIGAWSGHAGLRVCIESRCPERAWMSDSKTARAESEEGRKAAALLPKLLSVASCLRKYFLLPPAFSLSSSLLSIAFARSFARSPSLESCDKTKATFSSSSCANQRPFYCRPTPTAD